MFDQRGELPLLPFGNPIGFVPASRGGVYIESIVTRSVESRFIYSPVLRLMPSRVGPMSIRHW